MYREYRLVEVIMSVSHTTFVRAWVIVRRANQCTECTRIAMHGRWKCRTVWRRRHDLVEVTRSQPRQSPATTAGVMTPYRRARIGYDAIWPIMGHNTPPHLYSAKLRNRLGPTVHGRNSIATQISLELFYPRLRTPRRLIERKGFSPVMNKTRNDGERRNAA